MECVEKLKEIGAKKINAKTKIDARRLEDIFECRFDQMDRTRAKGFLGILQREYCIDMSEWLWQYDDYHQRERAKLEQEAQAKNENLKVSFIDSTLKDKRYRGLLVAFIGLVLLFFLYFIYNNFFSEKGENVENTDKNAQNIAKNDEEARPSYTDIFAKESAGVESNPQTSGETNNLPKEAKDSPSVSDPSNAESSANTVAAEANAAEKSGESSAQASESSPQNTLIITPKSPLWVGIVETQSLKKKQVSISERWTMPLTNDIVIITGHGHFDIGAGGEAVRELVGGNGKIFYWTRDGGLKDITRKEYQDITKGQGW